MKQEKLEKQETSLEENYDVAIVGGGVAGSAAAILFSRYGLRVALIEKQRGLDAYKRLCTHLILPCAMPILDELGLVNDLKNAGAIPTHHTIWTKWGWVRNDHLGDESEIAPPGFNIRRSDFDPIIRRQAISSNGVDYFPGYSVKELNRNDSGKVTGIEIEGDERIVINASLVVGADGSKSAVAKLINAPTKKQPNNRFCYYSYYKNLPLSSGNDVQIWLTDPDVGYCFPNPNNETLACVMLSKDKYQSFKNNPRKNLESYLSQLPNAPDFSKAEVVDGMYGVFDLPLYQRPAAHRGVVLIGDAAITTDPFSGAGISWALNSAKWLTEHVGEALAAKLPLAKVIEEYKTHHFKQLNAHHNIISLYSSGERFALMERIMYHGATRNIKVAKVVHNTASRTSQPYTTPCVLLSALWSYCRNGFNVDNTNYNWQPSGIGEMLESHSALLDTG